MSRAYLFGLAAVTALWVTLVDFIFNVGLIL